MKDRLLHLYSVFVDAFGINNLFQFVNRNRGIILWYHGIRGNDANPSTIYGDMHLPVSVFKRQLNYLIDRGYCFTSLSDIVHSVAQKKHYRKLVTLTFDDGFANVVELAYPIMKELHVKGCLYVVSDNVGKKEMLWPDRVAVAIENSPLGQFKFYIGDEPIVYVLNGPSSYNKAVGDIIRRMRLMPDRLRRETLEQFPNPSEFPDLVRILSLKELMSLDRDVIEIGSHTSSHCECTRLIADSEFKHELGDSKETLEGFAGYEVVNFCYPSGDFNQKLAGPLAKYGYRTAATTAPGFVDKDSESFSLNRINAVADFALFKTLVSGSSHWLFKLNYRIRNNRGYRK